MNSSRAAFALLETLVSMAILLIIILVMTYLSGSKSPIGTLNARERCQNLVNEIVNSVPAYNNSLFMRNFFPTTAVNTGPAPDATDLFCNPARNICQSNEFYGFGTGVSRHTTGFWREPKQLYIGGVCQPFDYLNNYQNIRSSASWAQSLYNQWAFVAADLTTCTGNGRKIGTSVALNAIMPRPSSSSEVAAFFPGASEGFLYIKDSTAPCGTRSNIDSATAGALEIKATLTFPGKAGTESCSATHQVSFVRDGTGPTLNAVMTNGGGTPVANAGQTDGGVFTGGPEYQTLHIDLTASEPGLVYFCRQSGPLFVDPPDCFKLCSELTVPGAVVSINPDYTTIPTYNKPTNLRITLSDLDDNPTAYGLEIRAVDVGGNDGVMNVQFTVKSP